MENTEGKKLRSLRLKDLDDDTIVRLYKVNKLSVYAIAKLLGYEYMTVRHRLKRLGLYEPGGHKDRDLVPAYDKQGNIIGVIRR